MVLPSPVTSAASAATRLKVRGEAGVPAPAPLMPSTLAEAAGAAPSSPSAAASKAAPFRMCERGCHTAALR